MAASKLLPLPCSSPGLQVGTWRRSDFSSGRCSLLPVGRPKLLSLLCFREDLADLLSSPVWSFISPGRRCHLEGTRTHLGPWETAQAAEPRTLTSLLRLRVSAARFLTASNPMLKEKCSTRKSCLEAELWELSGSARLACGHCRLLQEVKVDGKESKTRKHVSYSRRGWEGI